MKKKISVYIVGAGGFGRELESWAGLTEEFKNRFAIRGYLDDNPDALSGYPSELKVLSNINDFQFNTGDCVLLSIVNPELKRKAVDLLKGKVRVLPFFFKNAIIGKSVNIGEGSIIGPNCVLSSNVLIGQFVTILDNTSIGHDSTISDFSSIMGHVDVSGNVNIGKSVVIGSNLSIPSGIKISDNCRIRTGTSVTGDLSAQSSILDDEGKNDRKPKLNQRIWLSPPHMGGNELKYIQDAFTSNWIAPLGPNVDSFEESIVRYCGVKSAAALSSGTAAIHLALIVLGVTNGDEVITASFTFSATVNPIVYLGAIPVFVDSERDTWNMCPETLEIAIKDRLTRGKKPKAIILVHIYGMPANIEKIMEIANRYEIPVIEDAAEAMGSRYKGISLGAFGKLGVLSFNGNKIITTSGGGAIISNDESLITQARFLSKQARDLAPHYQHTHVGYNYRMSNILAGVGLGQMEILGKRIIQKREIYNFYKKNMDKYEGIYFQAEPDKAFFSNRWLTTIIIDPEKISLTKEEFQAALEKENIESRPLWKPMHLQPVFSSCPVYLNGISEDLFARGLCLPSGTNMSEEDLNRTLNVFIKCLKQKSYSFDFD